MIKTLDKLLVEVIAINKNLYKAALAENGYTQYRFAEALGMAESTLIRKVKTDSFTVEEVKKILSLLNLKEPTAIFFDREDT